MFLEFSFKSIVLSIQELIKTTLKKDARKENKGKYYLPNNMLLLKEL